MSARARELLARHGLRAKKSWGQNFLVDEAVQARIVGAAALGPDDVAVEIGAGLGALTGRLAERAGQVIAVERDPDMIAVLEREQELHAWRNVRVVAADALTLDLAAQAGRPIVVVGNLPYQITSPLIFRVIESGPAVARAVLMVQREFAERMTAPPGSKTYGRLSVMAQQLAAVEILFHVGASSFHPRPAVTSTVMRVTPRSSPLAPVRDPALFAAVVKAAFGARRKMLRRALGAAFGPAPVAQALAAAGIAETRRAEELPVADLARLTDALEAARA